MILDSSQMANKSIQIFNFMVSNISTKKKRDLFFIKPQVFFSHCPVCCNSVCFQDRLEDAVSCLRQLSTRAELLSPEAPGPEPGLEPGWQRKAVWRAEGELQELMLGSKVWGMFCWRFGAVFVDGL